MGLFSFLSKNKQDSSLDASGRFSRADDDGLAERARSKRATHAGEGGRRGKGGIDPMLPEKKRARRRLVGSIALALAAAVGLPMLLDSEPKPLAGDIAIQIPAKDKVPPLPLPSNPAPAAVAASDTMDKGEEIVPAPSAKPAAANPPVDTRNVAALDTAKSGAEPAKTEAAKHDTPRSEPKPEHQAPARPEPKVAEPRPVEKPAKAALKIEEKPARAQDDARALALLEGKQADKAHEAPGQKYVLQVAALASQEKANELLGRLREAGIHAFTQKVSRPTGELIRVKVGPFSKEEAEKVRAQLGKLGLSGTLAPA
jgi:DedD protein